MEKEKKDIKEKEKSHEKKEEKRKKPLQYHN